MPVFESIDNCFTVLPNRRNPGAASEDKNVEGAYRDELKRLLQQVHEAAANA